MLVVPTEVLLLWICFIEALVSIKGQKLCDGPCRTVILEAALHSEVSLPCSFKPNHINLVKGRGEEAAMWSHRSSLVVINSTGQVAFMDHRGGRVKVFPNLSQRGNFSIVIDELQHSDLGTYCCVLSDICWIVEIKPSKPPNGNMTNTPESADYQFQWDNRYFIIAAFTIIIIFVFGCGFFFEYRVGFCVKLSSNSYNVNTECREGQSVETVYENDEPYPNQMPDVSLQAGQHSQKDKFQWSTPQRSSSAAPYYVNQAEIDRLCHAAMMTKPKKIKAKESDFRNPIYDINMEESSHS